MGSLHQVNHGAQEVLFLSHYELKLDVTSGKKHTARQCCYITFNLMALPDGLTDVGWSMQVLRAPVRIRILTRCLWKRRRADS
jgi:hypothetical protein